MQQTEKYKFNLIDPSDEFSPDPLNDNASKLETALNSHESAVETRLTAQDAAIARADGHIAVVKLAGPVENTSPGNVTLNLSGVDMSQYRALLVLVYGDGDASVTTSQGGGCSLADRNSATGLGLSVFYHWRDYIVHGSVHMVEGTDIANMFRAKNDWNAINSVTITGNAYSAVVYGFKN